MKKLNYKGSEQVLVLDTPESFYKQLEEWKQTGLVVQEHIPDSLVNWVMIFVTEQEAIERWVESIAPLLEGDAIVWMAYPKGTSKRFKCDFNRDTGWESLGKAGLEGVRQVAIDEDWSALRFRKAEYIKSMTRDTSRAISEAGKRKLQ